MLQPTTPATYVSCLHGRYLSANNLRVLAPGYDIRYEKSDPPHQWGRGGECESRTFLVTEKAEVVLMSRWYMRYETYSDDSEDYEVENSSDTYLLREDPVARRIFEEISRQAAERGHGTQHTPETASTEM